MVKKVFPASNLQAMDIKKIKLLRQDRADLHHRQAEARQRRSPRAPRRRTVGFVDGEDSTKFAKAPTQWLTLIPTIYNADTLGIRPDLVGRPIEQLEGHPGPEVQGQDLDPQHPVDRHHGCRDGLRVGRHREVRRQGQHDQGGDRQDHRFPDQDQEGRPVPRLLEDLRREGQPDGLGRGGDPVDVVAGGHGGARQGRALRLPAAQGRLSRLGRRPGARQAPHRARARRGLRVHQLVPVGLGRRASSTARATTRRCSRPPRPT